MTDLKDFVSDFEIEVMGCPRALMERVVREGAIELCEQTLLLKKKNITVSVVEDEAEYSLSLNSKYELIGLHKVNVGDIADKDTLDITSEHDLEQRFGFNWRYMTAATPTDTFINADKKLQVFPTPTTDMSDDLTVAVVVKPATSATQLDDILYTDYHLLIAHYCRWRLMAIPGQLWSNDKLAAYYETKWEQGVATGRIRLLKNFSSKGIRVKHRSFIT